MKHKRKFWIFALLLIPFALAVPLLSAASWRPHAFGLHPIRGQALPPFAPGMMAMPPQFRLMMAPDGAHLLSISTECKPCGLAMWDARGERVLWTKPQDAPMQQIPRGFSPDGKTLLVINNPDLAAPKGILTTPMLTLLDAASGAQIGQFSITERDNFPSINDAAFAPDGKQLTAATNQKVLAWDVTTRREISRAPVKRLSKTDPKRSSAYLTLAPDAAHFVADWTTFINDTQHKPLRSEVRDKGGHVLWQMPGTGKPFFYFSPDGASLMVVENFDNYRVFDVKTGHLLWKRKITGANMTPHWLAGSRSIAVQNSDEIQLLDAKTGKVTRIIPLADAPNFVVSPDQSQLYSINAQGKITRQRLK